ncbi:glycosyltransferase [Staphylococcus condimenti]|uniref:glycosyltransferase n=1 Tax=Staphylococcus condimenti TaxID=70255 RepID=UPI0009FA0F59|nr:glycosyltransferase [Staphylococcus condimenti]
MKEWGNWMSKLNTLKKILLKQKQELEKPIVKYKQEENFKNAVDFATLFNNKSLKKNQIVVAINSLPNNQELFLIRELQQKYSNKKVYIAIKDDVEIGDGFKELNIVKFSDSAFLNLLATSKYIISNTILPTFYIRDDRQILIQTSDCITKEFDQEYQFDREKIRIQHSLFQASHLLFKTENEVDKYLPLFNLKGIFEGHVYSDANFYIKQKNSKIYQSFILLNNIYSNSQISKILSKADEALSDYYIVAHPEVYEYYSEIEELKYLLVSQDNPNETLNFDESIIMSDKETDLIGKENIYYHIDEENELYFMQTDKRLFQPNFDIIFNIINKKEENFFKVSNGKINIIMYCGGFLPNGITSSAINLSHSINYDKYNLIIVEKGQINDVMKYNMERINTKANLVFRIGQSNTTFNEYRKNQFITQRRGYREFLGKRDFKNFSNRELKRLLGNINLDVAVDFSGYVPFWTSIFAFADINKKVVYQHNDLLAETQKKIQGQYKHKYILPRVFSLYKFYDKVLSVSEPLKELNAKNLKKYANYNQFDFVNNIINFNDILSKLSNKDRELIISNSEEDIYLLKQMKDVSIVEIENKQYEGIKLVTIGRLSPEKDHEKLFRAVKKFKDKNPGISIQLEVLGSGVLYSELQELIVDLGLQNSVYLLGQVNNPYQYLERCDCFVLSSNHEGQPMVLLEALSIGKPIIATDITGNRSVLDGTNGLLVENSTSGLVEGLEKYAQNLVKDNHEFNINDYNKAAIQMFYSKISN